jgi:hypothetical protein
VQAMFTPHWQMYTPIFLSSILNPPG